MTLNLVFSIYSQSSSSIITVDWLLSSSGMIWPGNTDESNASVKFSSPSRILSSNIAILNGTTVTPAIKVTLYGPSS